jgi:hypothetical protein
VECEQQCVWLDWAAEKYHVAAIRHRGIQRAQFHSAGAIQDHADRPAVVRPHRQHNRFAEGGIEQPGLCHQQESMLFFNLRMR